MTPQAVTPQAPASEKEERAFRRWYGGYSKATGNNQNPDDPEHFYDYRGFFKANGAVPVQKGMHLPDEWKREGHPRGGSGGTGEYAAGEVDDRERPTASPSAADDEAKHWAESKPAARAPSGEEAAANVLSEMLRAGATGNEIRAAGRQFGFDVEPVIEGAVADQLQAAVQRGAADRYLRTIARHYGYDSEELMAGLREQRSTGRNVMDTVAEAAGGIVGTAGNIVGTAGIVADYAGASENNPAAKLSRYFHGLVPETAMADTTTGQVAQGLGSAAMFAAAGGAGRAAGMSTTAAVGTTGSVASFSPGYWDAKQHGASDVTALASGLLNAGVGYSEAFPLAKILDRATAGSGGAALRYMLSEGTEELLQSSGQQLAGNLIAKALYDEDRAVLEGVLASGKAGFLTGAIASALGTGAARLAGPQDAGRGVPAGEARRPEGAPVVPGGAVTAPVTASETGISDPNAPRQVLRRPNAGTLGGPAQIEGRSEQIEGRPQQVEAGQQTTQSPEAQPLDPARAAQDTAQDETFAKAQARIEAVAYDPEPLADAVDADPDRVKKLAERMRAMGPQASVNRMREIYDPASADAPLVNALHELMTGKSIDEYRTSEADNAAFEAKQAEIGARPQYEGPAPIVGGAESELGVPRGTEPELDEEGTRTNFRRGMMLLRGMRSDGRITEAQFDAGVQRLFGADAGKPRRSGTSGSVELPNGRALPTTYELWEADDLIPSHDARKGFARNPDGDLNERPYHDQSEGKDSRDTVERIAGNPKPALLVTDTPSATDGPPIVNGRGVVLGGNARTMAQQLAYSRGGPAADRIRAAVTGAAPRYGLDASGMRSPVLVRVLADADAGRPGQLSRILNDPLTTAKTAITDAVSRGSKVTQEVASEVASVVQDGTLRESLGDPTATRSILRALRNAGAWSESDETKFMEARGILTPSGKDVVEQTLLGSVIADARTIAETAPGVRGQVLRAVPALLTIRREWSGIGDVVRNALEGVNEIRQSGQPLADVLNQQTIDERPWKRDELAVAMVRALENDTPTAFARRLNEVAQEISDAAQGQGDLFGSGEPQTAEQRLGSALGREDTRSAAGGVSGPDLFGADEAGQGLKLPKRPKQGPKSGATINPAAAVVGAIQGPQSMADEESRIEAARRMVQDRFVTLRRRERVARNKGSDLSGAETRMHGRATAKQGGLGREQDAVVKILRDSGETIEAAGDYLKARHAGPRDALIVERRAREIFEARAESIKKQLEELNRAAKMGAKVQGKLNTLSKRLAGLMADARKQAQATIPNGSGMDPARAQQILSAATPAQKQVASAVDRVRDTAREFMVESGLVSRETMDGWIAEFGPTYVPLKTLVEEDGAFAPGSGRSLNVRGPEADRAAGRGSEADNPLVRTFQDAQEAILRGEKNVVTQEFGKFAAANPHPSLWDAPRPGEASGEDVLNYKVAGEPFHVRVHDEQSLRTLKNLDPIQTNKLLRMAAQGARMMSGLHTSRNPEFILPNLVRDLESAGLNVSAEESVRLAARVVKNAIPNYRDVFRAIRDPQNGGTAQAREFIAEGGMTNWIEPESITKRLANMEKRLAEIPLRTKLRSLGQVFDDVSGAVENGVRLSYYKELIKLGVPVPKAIVAAKELVVNWSKKGEWGPFANTLFLFASAGVNGTARFGQVFVKNPKRAAAVAGSLMAAGYLAAMLSEAFAGEDDLDGEKWIDKRGEHDWRKYAMLLHPDGEATKLPLAPGWGYFYYLGGLAYRKQGSALAGDTFVGAVESFSPINGGSPGQLVSPWFTDPIVSVSENEDFASRTIYPEAFPGETKPEYQRTRRGTAASIALSKFASEMMGGTPARRGSIEIPPEAIDYLAAESVGGVGRFVQRAAITAEKILNGETPMWRDVPIVNRFKGDAPNTYVRQFRRDLQRMEAEAAAERAGEKFDGAVLDYLTEARAVDRIARMLAKDGDQAGAEREYAEFHKRFKHATSPTK